MHLSEGAPTKTVKTGSKYIANAPLTKLFFTKDRYSIAMPSIATLSQLQQSSFKSYRHKVKNFLLQAQIAGEAEEWQASNFALNEISGLRKSPRI